ncbi:MAG: hypothetical protein FJ398_04535 [Verrucomicrobia bacterium]|nr:hypothetical protein [Verrucomicrobiota bacterium]
MGVTISATKSKDNPRAVRTVRSFASHVASSWEPDGRAALPRSRSSVDAAPQQHRPTGDRFKGRVHGVVANAASQEPDGRASLSPASRVGRVSTHAERLAGTDSPCQAREEQGTSHRYHCDGNL